MGVSMEQIVKIALILIAVQTGFSALSYLLYKIKDKTSTKMDNVAWGMVNRISHGLAKMVDFISANRQH